MHPALLVDEILQVILEICLDDGKASLCHIARSCKAWKDPALDRIWRRLPSAAPLLSLLPNCSENSEIAINGSVQNESLSVFHSYANRVKHIVHSRKVLGDPSSILGNLTYPLPNLESSRIEAKAVGDFQLSTSLSPRLRVLHLNVGFAKSGS
ncbi:hypothetical protein HYDPIDRAFT_52223, partial [Hydnomerulius pinastri MD-312]